MKYICKNCGEEHEGWPALAFNSPDHYHNLSEDEKKNIAKISDDFCIIKNEDQTDRFIRAVLFQKVNDHCQNLEYGVWVSLSEKSYKDYLDNFKSDDHEGGYFGYLSNQIPGYENTLLIKTNVIVSKGNNRPEIIPQDDQIENEFVKDYYKGISKEEAEDRVNRVLKK
jgi:hypothetical protein